MKKTILVLGIFLTTGAVGMAQSLLSTVGTIGVSPTPNYVFIQGTNRSGLNIGGPNQSAHAISDLGFAPSDGGKIGGTGGSLYWNWSFRSDTWSGFAGDFVLYSRGGANDDYISPFIVQADGDVILGSGSYKTNRFGNVGIGTITPTEKLHVELRSNNTFNETAFLIGKSGRQLRFIPKLSDYGMTPLSINNDFGIFWNDGATGTNGKNGKAGLVIAPHADNPNGIRINYDGNVGIGTNKTSGFKLSVEGKMRAREIEVNASGWADFVFADGYELNSLSEVEKFIETNNHLPNVPSEKEVTEEGINLGEMDAILLRKIEELTLYIIALEKKVEKNSVK